MKGDQGKNRVKERTLKHTVQDQDEEESQIILPSVIKVICGDSFKICSEQSNLEL